MIRVREQNYNLLPMKLLTKSRFKQALECPNKLCYAANPQYANTKKEDSFLQSLAEGGFQVEALARLHYPDGIFIDTEPYEYEKSAMLTTEALRGENCVVYEAAFLFESLYVRTDILVKTGNRVRLIEVKAKSFDSTAENLFTGARGGITSGYKPYLFDLAYQKHVGSCARPDLEFEAWFMMADKSKRTTINGLNQHFRIPKNGNPRTGVDVGVKSLSEIGNSVLSEINVDNICNDIIADRHQYYDNLKFREAIDLFSSAYQKGEFLHWPPSFGACKACEYKLGDQLKVEDKLCGFSHCFSTLLGWKDEDFKKPRTMEVWNFRSGGKLFDQGRYFLDQLHEDDFNIQLLPDKLSAGERQWIQVQKARDFDHSIHVEVDGLRTEMQSWNFPLHFIDFETSAVALPFTCGRRPYEQVAFQFSHHQYNHDGTVEHKSEFISNLAGEFPNFRFVRALREALCQDQGTIFRFAAHENSILNAIINQLSESLEPDRDELIAFLKNITCSTRNSADYWEGDRAMVDLNRVVKDYYYNPLTRGSNSIKAVLPAALHSSDYLKKKYSQPIGNIKLTSKNFPGDFVWIDNVSDVANPYKMLPPLFGNWNDDEIQGILSELDGIADGGAAMTAYAKLQYVDMSDGERAEITQGLLKYCELDTLAMVMIYEHFRFDLLSLESC